MADGYCSLSGSCFLLLYRTLDLGDHLVAETKGSSDRPPTFIVAETHYRVPEILPCPHGVYFSDISRREIIERTGNDDYNFEDSSRNQSHLGYCKRREYVCRNNFIEFLLSSFLVPFFFTRTPFAFYKILIPNITGEARRDTERTKTKVR